MTVVACLVAIFATGRADAEHHWTLPTGPTGATGSTGATGTVNSLDAEPVIVVAVQKHCVSSTLTISPKYTGGKVVKSYLYVNGERAWTRSSGGAFKLKVNRFPRGTNAFEVVAVFADGRSASWVSTFRRCGRR